MQKRTKKGRYAPMWRRAEILLGLICLMSVLGWHLNDANAKAENKADQIRQDYISELNEMEALRQETVEKSTALQDPEKWKKLMQKHEEDRVASLKCGPEVKKYDWPQHIAQAVMQAESGGNPRSLNINPATGDHSVGCFQINILGALAKNRPSEAELKNAEINVKFAYEMWKNQGWSPWSVCKTGKVKCW